MDNLIGGMVNAANLRKFQRVYLKSDLQTAYFYTLLTGISADSTYC